MSKTHSSAQIQKALLKLGFVFICQKGSHGKFKSNNGRTVILPINKHEIPIGTFKSILRQAEINEKSFNLLFEN